MSLRKRYFRIVKFFLGQPKEQVRDPAKVEPDDPYTQEALDAVMGWAGGEGFMWGPDRDKVKYYGDDPLAVLSEVQMKQARISDRLWQDEEVKSEEMPPGLRDELKESG